MTYEEYQRWMQSVFPFYGTAPGVATPQIPNQPWSPPNPPMAQPNVRPPGAPLPAGVSPQGQPMPASAPSMVAPDDAMAMGAGAVGPTTGHGPPVMTNPFAGLGASLGEALFNRSQYAQQAQQAAAPVMGPPLVDLNEQPGGAVAQPPPSPAKPAAAPTPGLGQTLAPQGQPQGAPIAIPPRNPEEMRQRVTGWEGALKGLFADNNFNMMLIRMGTMLMQPVARGQTPMGHLGQAINAGMEYYNQRVKADADAELAKREIATKEAKTKGDIDYQRGTLQNQRSELEAKKGMWAAEAEYYRAHAAQIRRGGKDKDKALADIWDSIKADQNVQRAMKERGLTEEQARGAIREYANALDAAEKAATEASKNILEQGPEADARRTQVANKAFYDTIARRVPPWLLQAIKNRPLDTVGSNAIGGSGSITGDQLPPGAQVIGRKR